MACMVLLLPWPDELLCEIEVAPLHYKSLCMSPNLPIRSKYNQLKKTVCTPNQNILIILYSPLTWSWTRKVVAWLKLFGISLAWLAAIFGLFQDFSRSLSDATDTWLGAGAPNCPFIPFAINWGTVHNEALSCRHKGVLSINLISVFPNMVSIGRTSVRLLGVCHLPALYLLPAVAHGLCTIQGFAKLFKIHLLSDFAMFHCPPHSLMTNLRLSDMKVLLSFIKLYVVNIPANSL